jgi:hypothetical protein
MTFSEILAFSSLMARSSSLRVSFPSQARKLMPGTLTYTIGKGEATIVRKPCTRSCAASQGP